LPDKKLRISKFTRRANVV